MDDVPVADYKWVYDDGGESEFHSPDGLRMIKISYYKKVPMTKEDYLRMFKKGHLGKAEYLICLKRLGDKHG